MGDAQDDRPSTFPAPVRLDGYAAWAWRLFRAAFGRLALPFVGGVALVRTLHFLLVVAVSGAVAGEGGDVAALATSLGAGILLATVVGSLLVAVAAPVYVEHVSGGTLPTAAARRRLKGRTRDVIVAALYIAMPLVLLLFLLGPSVEILLEVMILPALLGPPVLAHAIVWEGRPFRDAATRAKNLLAGSWGRVVGALLLLTMGAALLQVLFVTVIAQVLPWDAPDAPVEYTVTLLIEVLTTALVWLFAAAAGTAAYLDLRARFEELDRAALGTEAAAARGAPTPG